MKKSLLFHTVITGNRSVYGHCRIGVGIRFRSYDYTRYLRCSTQPKRVQTENDKIRIVVWTVKVFVAPVRNEKKNVFAGRYAINPFDRSPPLPLSSSTFAEYRIIDAAFCPDTTSAEI